MLRVTALVSCYEKDGDEVKGLNHPEIKVESHWNRKAMVVICAPGASHNYTVCARDLIDALQKCSG